MQNARRLRVLASRDRVLGTRIRLDFAKNGPESGAAPKRLSCDLVINYDAAKNPPATPRNE
jgi:hypothetical protein